MADPMADHHTGYKQKILKETLFITRNLETATFPQKMQEKRKRTIFSYTNGLVDRFIMAWNPSETYEIVI